LQIHTALWNSMYQALDRPDWVFKWSVIAACLYVPAFVIGLRWGIAGVAAGYTVSTMILVPTQLGLVRRLVDFRMRDYLGSLQPIVLACVLMAGAVVSIQTWAVRSGAAPWVRLVVAIPVGVLVYLLAVTMLRRELVAGIWHTVVGLRRPRRTRLAEEAG
ncbi:MAG: polysaccharide biosynthesis C-terminal domain-containing protein, partial [Anaerolineales bacterium]